MPTLARNDDANHRYHILERFEAGIALTGAEVKAAKMKRVSLRGAYVTLLDSQAYLTGATISRYPKADPAIPYEPDRSRRLLLKRRELDSLVGKASATGLTLVPLELYTKGTLVKLAVGLARGKKRHDRRQEIAKRDADRRIARALRTRH